MGLQPLSLSRILPPRRSSIGNYLALHMQCNIADCSSLDYAPWLHRRLSQNVELAPAICKRQHRLESPEATDAICEPCLVCGLPLMLNSMQSVHSALNALYMDESNLDILI